MRQLRVAIVVLGLALSLNPATALDVDRQTVPVRIVEVPIIAVVGLDLDTVRTDVSFGRIEAGEPELKSWKTWCVPENSENRIRDAIEVPTHYFEVHYRTQPGFVVIRGEDVVLHAERVEPLESYRRFGFDRCKYANRNNLLIDFERQATRFAAGIEDDARAYYEHEAVQILENALFFNVSEENVPVYTFKDKQHRYDDLNQAAVIAVEAYRSIDGSVIGQQSEARSELERALGIWETALTESDLNDKSARVNRKVTTRLHESLGVARLLLGEPASAVTHLDKANRIRTFVTSRSNGTGTVDLLARARARRERARRNIDLPGSPVEIEALIAATDAYRGMIPVRLQPSHEYARLETEHASYSVGAAVETASAERAEREETLASGQENPFERMVGQTATQGFVLFLMPYPEKLAKFPAEVCGLKQLNRLRVPNHTFDSVPSNIGDLAFLEVLDLSGNRIEVLPPTIGSLSNLTKLDLSGNRIRTLPDSIGQLQNLRLLQLKDNPLEPGEMDRLKRLLPKCKIKV